MVSPSCSLCTPGVGQANDPHAMPPLDAQPEKLHLDWPEAPRAIAAHVCESHARDASGDALPVVTVGITGPVGSGKSTLARRLVEHLPGLVISTDDYLPEYATLAPHQYDDPARADLPLLAEHVQTLAAGGTIDKPVWSFASHRREGFTRVAMEPIRSEANLPQVPQRLLVVEGIFALCEPVAMVIDCAVFVDSPAADRWQRWESLTRAAKRGWSVEQARAFFHQHADPIFHARADACRRRACCIVSNPNDATG